eukprot:1191809-Prorocentrum_minimum.AAC.6
MVTKAPPCLCHRDRLQGLSQGCPDTTKALFRTHAAPFICRSHSSAIIHLRPSDAVVACRRLYPATRSIVPLRDLRAPQRARSLRSRCNKYDYRHFTAVDMTSGNEVLAGVVPSHDYRIELRALKIS